MDTLTPSPAPSQILDGHDLIYGIICSIFIISFIYIALTSSHSAHRIIISLSKAQISEAVVYLLLGGKIRKSVRNESSHSIPLHKLTIPG